MAAPIPQTDGGYVVTLDVPRFGRPVLAVLYEWLAEPTVGTQATPEIVRCLGEATRELHTLGESFRPNGPSFPILDDPYYGDEYRLADHDLDLALFEESANCARLVFDEFQARPKIPIHADLHLYNLKFGPTGLSVFDFDDAMVAWPIMDCAITMWYLRRHPRAQELEPYYWAGFGSSPADFGLTSDHFETLVAARTLLLVNDIVRTQNAGVQEEVVRFVRRYEAVLRHYQRTGRYAPWEVP